MNQEIQPAGDAVPIMARPFTLPRSQLGTITKIFTDKFLCRTTGVQDLHDAMWEKLAFLQPSKVGFQYLVSFDDRTHVEHTRIDELEQVARNNKKTTNRLVLKWDLVHEIDAQPNDLTVIVRIANPVSPLHYMQALFSTSPDDVDSLEFEWGFVSASVNGAGQILAEEIFSLVSNWIDSCPQPEYITNIHKKLQRHKNKIQFLNFWLLPLLVSAIFFGVLWRAELGSLLFPVLFAAIVSTYYLRNITTLVNSKIEKWISDTRAFSIFAITGGDSNQQNKFAARSKRSTIKLVVATAVTFALNVAAGITTIALVQ